MTRNRISKEMIDKKFVGEVDGLSQQLADKANKGEVLNLIGNVSEGTPLIANSVEEMTETNRNYVNTTDGLIYAYNGEAWVSTGVRYQSTGIAEGSIKPTMLDGTTAKIIGIEKLNLNWVVGVIQSGNVNELSKTGIATTGFIELDKEVEIIFDSSGGSRFQVAYYTSTGVFTGVYSGWLTESTVIPAQTNRKIRIDSRYLDSRAVNDVYELLKYINIVKKTASIDTLNNRLTVIEEQGKDQTPVYWESHLTSKINKIKSLQREIGYEGTSFLFITDAHWDNNTKNSPSLVKRVVEECEIPFVLDGGDLASNPAGVSKQGQINELLDYKKQFSFLGNRVLRTIGNHDDNSINDLYSMTITDREMYDIVFRQYSSEFQIHSGNDGHYFYADDRMQKIRYISLNSIDIPYIEGENDTLVYNGMDHWAFRQEQIDWFADVALNVPGDGWSVVVMSHIPINQGYLKNDHIAMRILQAFVNKSTYSGSNNAGTVFEVNKSVDYTGKGGNAICWLAGHIHLDRDILLPEDITFKELTTVNDSLHVKSGAPAKAVGTPTENAFDVFTIDKANRRVYVTRIGAGEDREFYY